MPVWSYRPSCSSPASQRQHRKDLWEHLFKKKISRWTGPETPASKCQWPLPLSPPQFHSSPDHDHAIAVTQHQCRTGWQGESPEELKKTADCGRGNGSLSKIFAVPTWVPEFNPQHQHHKGSLVWCMCPCNLSNKERQVDPRGSNCQPSLTCKLHARWETLYQRGLRRIASEEE